MSGIGTLPEGLRHRSSDMKDANHLIVPTLFVLIAMLGVVQVTRAQDPTRVDPANYNALYENNAAPILEYRNAVGHKIPKQFHPAYFVYVISDADRLFPIMHCGENANTDTHLLIIELSNSRAASG